MKKKRVIWIVVGVVVVGILAAMSLISDTNSGTRVNAAVVDSQRLIEKVSASGRIQPKTKVDITSEINGEIIALPVREGQRVAAGDLLVVLDTVQVTSDVRQARYSLDEIDARLDGGKSTLEQAKEEFERQSKLYEQNLTSETAYNNSRYDYLNAESSYKAMQAQSWQLQAVYEKQIDYLNKAKIVAPMAGIVTFLDVEVGEIAAAQTAYTQGKTLMTISDLSVFEVEVEVDETEINKVELGQQAEIEVDAIPDTTFAGEVVEIGNTAVTSSYGSQDQSTNFNVKVTFKDVGLKLRPGMSATVDITTAERENALTVPFSAIVVRSYDMDSLLAAREVEEGESVSANAVHAAENGEDDSTDSGYEDKHKEYKGVFAIKEGMVRFVAIETGVADQKNIEVIGGLEKGDSVVSGPYNILRTIRDGDEIQVTQKTRAGEES